ncbi:tyrosine-type recombinase/integrase, partial [Neisseria shayeganii]
MPLNDLQIKRSKPAVKPYKLADGGGLYLHVTPAGGKLWRFDYAIDRKRKTLSIGKYPAVSLSEARAAAEHARYLLAQGQDPAAAKQEAKQARQAALLNTFAAVACRWHTDNLNRWKPNHAARIMRYFEADVFPLIGQTPIAELRVRDVKAVIDAVAARGVIETAEKIRQWISSICNYAAMLEIMDANPAAPLTG